MVEAEFWWERRRPDEATSEYLARVLRELGADELAERAEEFHYDDYKCPPGVDDGMNINRLVRDLAAFGDNPRVRAVVRAAMNGEFDGTSEEARAWAASEDGCEAFLRAFEQS